MGAALITQIYACLDFLRPVLPKDARERLERKAAVEAGATFSKRNFTFGGFTLSSQSIFVQVRTSEQLAIIWRPSDDSSPARGAEIHAGDMKGIEGSGGKSIVVTSKKGDILLEIEASDEEQRDQWLRGMNEVLLNNFKVGADGVTGVAPKGLKERAEKEVYFQKKHLELQAKKKEAEERKSKYMKEVGGLKYTALAMANREG